MSISEIGLMSNPGAQGSSSQCHMAQNTCYSCSKQAGLEKEAKSLRT